MLDASTKYFNRLSKPQSNTSRQKRPERPSTPIKNMFKTALLNKEITPINQEQFTVVSGTVDSDMAKVK